MSAKIIFITGTGTGVGKTLLTALLLCHLRSEGSHVFALKPFCSGSRADAQLLHGLQEGALGLDEINPFYFPEPVAPLVSARKHNRRISLAQVVQHINSIASRVGPIPRPPAGNPIIKNSKSRIQNYILVEGSGGLLVPLGENYTVRDLIRRLDCEVIVVSRNQLGTINHTLLTVQALQNPAPHSPFRLPASAVKVVLMDTRVSDPSCGSNASLLAELLAPISLVRLPFLGPRCCSAAAVRTNSKKSKKTLASLSL